MSATIALLSSPQLTDDQIRAMLAMSGGGAPLYGRLYLAYLSALHMSYTSLQQLLDSLALLRTESQEYKLDLYLYFNKELSATVPPQINQREIEILFIEGGTFITLSILQYLSSKQSTFNSFDHLKESIHAQVEPMLKQQVQWKKNLIKFLTCTNINEFVMDGSSTSGSNALGAPASSSSTALSSVLNQNSSSPLLAYRVTLDTVRHLLYIGANDVQLIYLMTRIYNLLQGKRIKDEKRLIARVKKEWNEYLLTVSKTLEWLRNPEKNLLFVESQVTTVATGHSGPLQSKVTTIVHVPPHEIDGSTVEKLIQGGCMAHLTLLTIKNFSKAGRKFKSIDELTLAIKEEYNRIESMTSMYTYLNSFQCALFPRVARAARRNHRGDDQVAHGRAAAGGLAHRGAARVPTLRAPGTGVSRESTP